MSNLENKFAIVVHTCDRYAFLYKGFEFFFHRNWDRQIACSKYFLTEEYEAQVKGFENVKSGKGEWSDRLRVVLEKLPEEWIIYIQEDMWFTKPVNAKIFNLVLDYASKKDILQFKLHSSEVYKTRPAKDILEGLQVGILDNPNSGYLMSHQITIWNRKFLMQQLLPKEHPWRNERKGTKRLRKLNKPIYHLDLFAENGKPAINNNVDTFLRSEYRTVSVNGAFSENVEPFLEIMLTDDDSEIIAYAKQVKHNFDHQLTHDGRPKPRKQDIFKKIKSYFKNLGSS